MFLLCFCAKHNKHRDPRNVHSHLDEPAVVEDVERRRCALFSDFRLFCDGLRLFWG